MLGTALRFQIHLAEEGFVVADKVCVVKHSPKIQVSVYRVPVIRRKYEHGNSSLVLTGRKF